MSALFSPLKLKDVTLRNRIAVPPMCQYSATDGFVNDWHKVHYASLARGGSGLVIVEATGVTPDGRITPKCLGLWNEKQAEGLAEIVALIKQAGSVPGIQIAHAGRKASANIPWEGDDHLPESDLRAWEPISPSALAFGANLPRVPRAMTPADIERIKQAYVDAAIRARDAGFEWLELHFAHGYLAQSFFSVHANKRTDEYGGDFAGRSRFLVETFNAVRAVWPENLPLTARFGVLEFDGRDDETLDEAIALTRIWKDAGLDLLNVSMGFSTTEATIPWGQGMLVPIAEKVRTQAEIPVATSWCIDNPQKAEAAVAGHQADLIMVGRAQLANPHWVYSIARQLEMAEPEQYLPSPYGWWLERYTYME